MAASRIIVIAAVAVALLPISSTSMPTYEAVSPASNTSTNTTVPISWQSVYFALLPLGLNAMTIPSSLDLNTASSVLFPMHSSPIFCLSSALEMSIFLAGFLLSGDSFAEAVARFQQLRKPRGSGNTLPTASTGTSPNLTFTEMFPRGHLLLFLLGPLPQFVKLCGLRGVPWSVASGVVFLGSSVLLSLPRVVNTENIQPAGLGPRAKRFYGAVTTVLNIVAVGIQLAMWIWLTHLLLGDYGVYENTPLDQEPKHPMIFLVQIPFIFVLMLAWPITQLIGPLFLIIGTIKLLWGPGNSCDDDCNDYSAIGAPPSNGNISYIILRRIWRGIMILGAIPLYICIEKFLLHFPKTTEEKSRWILIGSFYCAEVTIIVVLLATAALSLLIAVSLLCRNFPALRALAFPPSMWTMRSPLVLFPAFNLLLPLLYYGFVYDSTGTIKPGWTDKLG